MVAALLNCHPDFRMGHSILMSSAISSLTELSIVLLSHLLGHEFTPGVTGWLTLNCHQKLSYAWHGKRGLPTEIRCVENPQVWHGSSELSVFWSSAKPNLRPETQGNNNPSSPTSGHGSQTSDIFHACLQHHRKLSETLQGPGIERALQEGMQVGAFISQKSYKQNQVSSCLKNKGVMSKTLSKSE